MWNALTIVGMPLVDHRQTFLYTHALSVVNVKEVRK